ncbi:hypothetical protein BDZ89DRAFT_1136094 [Hymenopellis radicata]|nr:hypothetical protein BDZ89DRAFT_1136094 [Hymenopellis radicata]
MPPTVSQCANCGAFTRHSLHHEEEYQSSVLLERLRTSNFPASNEEISHIRHTILPTITDNISSIESKVASLREVITSMEEERGRLLNVQKKYNNLVSLHRTLPSEIWSEIFMHMRSRGCSDPNAFDASGPIWQLSHVCQKWRNIALSLRSFWSTMNLCFPEAAQHEGDVQRLEAVIQRSRQELLDVSLSYDSDLSDGQTPSSDIINRMLEIVLTESYRWRELHLSDCDGSLIMLYAALHHRLPHLESLSLYFAQINPTERSVFKDCPRLTKLTLGGGTPLVVDFPWDQITELDLFHMDRDDEEERRACMRLIRQCPSLEILSTPCSWGSVRDGNESPYTPITCSNMRELMAYSVPVIDALTLPHLREASLHPESTAYCGILSSFKQLLLRSSCLSTLTSLSLSGVPLAAAPEATLYSILWQTHSLTFLKVTISVQAYDDQTDVRDREQIVAILNSLEVVPPKTVTVFLPLLSYLHIWVYNHSNSSTLQYFGPVGSFASMLKARWEGDDTDGLARLRTCCFAVQAPHLKQCVDRDAGSYVAHIFNEAERFTFNALIEDGMDLSIHITSDYSHVGGYHVVFSVRS